jgi:hypothetical protein
LGRPNNLGSQIDIHAYCDGGKPQKRQEAGKVAIRDIRNPEGVADRATLLQKAQALDEIAKAVARYLASEGHVRRDDLIADIANTIELKTNYIFIDRGEIELPAFRMSAHQRIV